MRLWSRGSWRVRGDRRAELARFGLELRRQIIEARLHRRQVADRLTQVAQLLTDSREHRFRGVRRIVDRRDLRFQFRKIESHLFLQSMHRREDRIDLAIQQLDVRVQCYVKNKHARIVTRANRGPVFGHATRQEAAPRGDSRRSETDRGNGEHVHLGDAVAGDDVDGRAERCV